jgi:hypothetical protein
MLPVTISRNLVYLVSIDIIIYLNCIACAYIISLIRDVNMFPCLFPLFFFCQVVQWLETPLLR